MFCKHCGKGISDDAKFCDGCGKPISVESNTFPTPNKSKKKKKAFYKRWWFWVIVFLYILGGVSSKKDPSAITPTETSTAQIETTQPESEAESISLEALVEILDNVADECYEDYTLTYTDELIQIDVWKVGIVAGVDAAANGDEECLQSWNTLVEEYRNTSSTLYDFVKQAGYSDVSLSLNLVNELDHDKSLLATLNGVVIYDCLSDSK